MTAHSQYEQSKEVDYLYFVISVKEIKSFC